MPMIHTQHEAVMKLRMYMVWNFRQLARIADRHLSPQLHVERKGAMDILDVCQKAIARAAILERVRQKLAKLHPHSYHVQHISKLMMHSATSLAKKGVLLS